MNLQVTCNLVQSAPDRNCSLAASAPVPPFIDIEMEMVLVIRVITRPKHRGEIITAVGAHALQEALFQTVRRCFRNIDEFEYLASVLAGDLNILNKAHRE